MSALDWVLVGVFAWVAVSCALVLCWVGLVTLAERRAYRAQVRADKAEEMDELRYRAARVQGYWWGEK